MKEAGEIHLTFRQIVSNTLKILTRAEKQKSIYLLLINTLISVLDIASMIMLVVVIAFYTKASHIFLSYLPAWLYQKEGLTLFIIFLLFMVVKNWAALLVARIEYSFFYSVALRISKENLENYLAGSYETYVKTDSAVSIRQISYQPLEFSQHVLAGLLQMVTELILITITIGVIVFYQINLFLILFVVLLPLVLLVAYLIRRKLKSVRTHIKSSNEKALQYLQEALTGFVDINIYKGKDFFTHRYFKEQERLGSYLPDLLVSQAMSARLLELFAVLGLFFLFLFNQYLGNSESDAIINIGAFTAAAYKIIPGIIKILNQSEQAKTFGFTTINLTSGQQENRQAHIKTEPVKHISFRDVCYCYHDKQVLYNFSTTIQSGDFIGISGPSGIGKTTLVNLLLGFLEEQSGHILINNKTVSLAERQSYATDISYVKQQTFLIHDTILSNICFDTTIDREKFEVSVRVSGLDKLIATIPEGYEKIITEHGKNLSGGQRQRIAIARALYKKADVYILDEPFNELDEASEIKLLEYFSALAKTGCIVLLITHNPKSLGFCSRVISL